MGLRIKDGAANKSIHDNVIGSNHGPGVDMWDYYTSNDQIYNNRIGVAVDGSAAPNPIGVQLAGNTNTLGPNNIIAFNTGQGVRVTTTMSDGGTPSRCRCVNNTITRNSIYSNGSLGIDIDPSGSTPTIQVMRTLGRTHCSTTPPSPTPRRPRCQEQPAPAARSKSSSPSADGTALARARRS